jgi:hypothetical protein
MGGEFNLLATAEADSFAISAYEKVVLTGPFVDLY